MLLKQQFRYCAAPDGVHISLAMLAISQVESLASALGLPEYIRAECGAMDGQVGAQLDGLEQLGRCEVLRQRRGDDPPYRVRIESVKHACSANWTKLRSAGVRPAPGRACSTKSRSTSA